MLANNNLNPSDRFIREKELLEIVGLSRSSVYRQEKAGTFPLRKQIGPNCVAWRLSEVQEWMDDPGNYQVKNDSDQSENRRSGISMVGERKTHQQVAI